MMCLTLTVVDRLTICHFHGHVLQCKLLLQCHSGAQRLLCEHVVISGSLLRIAKNLSQKQQQCPQQVRSTVATTLNCDQCACH